MSQYPGNLPRNERYCSRGSKRPMYGKIAVGYDTRIRWRVAICFKGQIGFQMEPGVYNLPNTAKTN